MTQPRELITGVLLVACAGCPAPHPSTGATPQGGQATTCSTVASVDSAVYDTTQLDQQPAVRTVPVLTYPPDAERRHVQGRVVIGAVVGASGFVDSSSIVIATSVDPLLDAEAVRFVLGARLWPGCRAGAPVRVRVAVPVVFAMRRPLVSPKDAFWMALVVGLTAGLVAHGH
jgi:protein TonB